MTYIWLVRDAETPQEGLFFERAEDAREWYEHIGGRGEARIERIPYPPRAAAIRAPRPEGGKEEGK